MTLTERAAIVSELSCVDEVITFDDSDNSACDAIEKVVNFNDSNKVIFANGGDRIVTTTPELSKYEHDSRVEFAFSVGGNNKLNSSSWILRNWSSNVTQRPWGSYAILNNDNGWQVKELTFCVDKSLSDQRHFYRSEHWHVVRGKIRIDLEYQNGNKESKVYITGDSVDIPINTWHKATNVGTEDAKVIEVWLGDNLTETDIERRE